ncbi:MAG: hypothetical protein EOM41_02345 [Bacilli bacterium]|nr:hypothetical protein [Bacilli bacterium]
MQSNGIRAVAQEMCIHSQQSYYNKNTCKCKCSVSLFLHFKNFALLLVW